MAKADRFCTHGRNLIFCMDDDEMIIFYDFCHWVGAKELSYEKWQYKVILENDFTVRFISMEFMEFITNVKYYIEKWKPSIDKRNFDIRLLLSLYFYIERNVSYSRCLDFLLGVMNFGITLVELTPCRMPEECKYEYRIKIEVLDYYNELFNECLWNCKDRIKETD